MESVASPKGAETRLAVYVLTATASISPSKPQGETAVARTHKRQHTIPRSYLSSWIEPVTPPGQTSAIILISKDRQTVRRKSPEKCFAQTDRYTLHLKDGQRDLRVEHQLASIESDFQGVLASVRREQRLTLLQKAKLCAFVAAMMARSKKQGDWMLQQRRDMVGMIRDMELARDVEATASSELEQGLQDHHGTLVAQLIPVIAPVLFQMPLSILTTNDSVGFITSDAPAVMFNPEAHTFPPMYRSPGLQQKDVEIRLPLDSPASCSLFAHTPPRLLRWLDCSGRG